MENYAMLQCLCQWNDVGKENGHSDLHQEAISSPKLSPEIFMEDLGSPWETRLLFSQVLVCGAPWAMSTGLFCLKMGFCRHDLPPCKRCGLALRSAPCWLTSCGGQWRQSTWDQELRKRGLWLAHEKKVHVPPNHGYRGWEWDPMRSGTTHKLLPSQFRVTFTEKSAWIPLALLQPILTLS